MRAILIAAALFATTPAAAGDYFVTRMGTTWGCNTTADRPKAAFIRCWNARPASARAINPQSPGVPVWATETNVLVFENYVCSNILGEIYGILRTRPSPPLLAWTARFTFQQPRC